MYGVVEEGRASWFLNIVIMTAPAPPGLPLPLPIYRKLPPRPFTKSQYRGLARSFSRGLEGLF